MLTLTVRKGSQRVEARYMRRPIQAAKAARATLASRLKMWKFARHGEKKFRGDARFNRQNVSDGFASRIESSNSDRGIVERICVAYSRAAQQKEFFSTIYNG